MRSRSRARARARSRSSAARTSADTIGPSPAGLVRMGDPVVERCVSVHAWRRIDTMARGCFCHGAKLHRGLGQPAQRLVENTLLAALEIRRTLPGLDVEISLGELGPFGSDPLAVGIGIEQDRCEAVGAASESAHGLVQLW